MVSNRALSFRACVRNIFIAEGVGGFFRGIVPCFIRATPTNGAAFMSAEIAMKYLPK